MVLKFNLDKNNIKRFLYEIGVEDPDQVIKCINDEYSLYDLIDLFQMHMVDTFNESLKEYQNIVEDMIENADLMYDVKDQRIH